VNGDRIQDERVVKWGDEIGLGNSGPRFKVAGGDGGGAAPESRDAGVLRGPAAVQPAAGASAAPVQAVAVKTPAMSKRVVPAAIAAVAVPRHRTLHPAGGMICRFDVGV
jgi:hypothetical protein